MYLVRADHRPLGEERRLPVIVCIDEGFHLIDSQRVTASSRALRPAKGVNLHWTLSVLPANLSHWRGVRGLTARGIGGANLYLIVTVPLHALLSPLVLHSVPDFAVPSP